MKLVKPRSKQRYSYLGLVICYALGVCSTAIMVKLFAVSGYTEPHESAEYAALRVQCENIGGLLATADGPYGTDVSCYKGAKKIWWVRL